MAERDRAELFAGWNLILQIASKGRRGERGALSRDGRPLTARDLAIMTGFPEAAFSRALSFFSTNIKWLESSDYRDISATSADPASNPEESPDSPAYYPDQAGLSPAEWKEENGKKRMEGKTRAAPAASAALSADAADSPAVAVVDAWNGQSSLPSIQALSSDRKRALKARLSDEFFSANFEEGIRHIAESKFCCGQNERGWKATFDWFLQPGTIAKVMEGKYDGKSGQKTIPLREGEQPPVWDPGTEEAA